MEPGYDVSKVVLAFMRSVSVQRTVFSLVPVHQGRGQDTDTVYSREKSKDAGPPAESLLSTAGFGSTFVALTSLQLFHIARNAAAGLENL